MCNECIFEIFSIALCSEKPINLLRAALLGAQTCRNASYQRPVRPATRLSQNQRQSTRACEHTCGADAHTLPHERAHTLPHKGGHAHTDTDTPGGSGGRAWLAGKPKVASSIPRLLEAWRVEVSLRKTSRPRCFKGAGCRTVDPAVSV